MLYSCDSPLIVNGGLSCSILENATAGTVVNCTNSSFALSALSTLRVGPLVDGPFPFTVGECSITLSLLFVLGLHDIIGNLI